jgi:hypothetical protein
MEDQIGLMPVGLRDRLCCCIVVQSLSRFLLETWIQETLQLIGAQLEGPDKMTASGDQKVPPKNTKKEVNCFFGWAIHSMTKRIRKKLKGIKKIRNTTAQKQPIRSLNFFGDLSAFRSKLLSISGAQRKKKVKKTTKS